MNARANSRSLLCLLLCALFFRALIPAGWMPVTTGKGYAISLCTGMGAITGWVDDQGNIHKDKPAKSDNDDQPCAFAGLFNVAALPDMAGSLTAVIMAVAVQAVLPDTTFAIGRGLAAPPPPPTGPPAIL